MRYLDADELSKKFLGKGRPAIIVAESGVIRLLMRSYKPLANKWKRVYLWLN